MSAVQTLKKHRQDEVVVARYIAVEERAKDMVAQAKAMAASVRVELKSANDRLLDCLHEAQSDGYDTIRVRLGNRIHYLKRKASRSPRVCRVSHLERAFDEITPEMLSLEQRVADADDSANGIFWKAVMRMLRNNDDLYSVSHQLVLDPRPMEKKTVVGDHGEGEVRVVDADPTVMHLVNRRRELEVSKAEVQRQVDAANTRAKNVRSRVDVDAVRRVVAETCVDGKQIHLQDADGQRTKLATHEKKTVPQITVTTLKGGLLEVIIDQTLEGVDFGDDLSELLRPDVRIRFLKACENVIARFREENTQSVSVLRTTKQRKRKASAGSR